MGIVKFKQQLVLTGPQTNLIHVYSKLIKLNAKEDLIKSTKQQEVIFCSNVTKIRPECAIKYQTLMATECSPNIPLEWFQTIPMIFWQTTKWWNYYFNVKHNTKRTAKTLNIPKQQCIFFEQFCIIE